MTTSTPGIHSDPLGRLIYRKASNFSDLPSGSLIDPAHRSRHNPGMALPRLGLGFVDGSAALLLGLVTEVHCSSDGTQGRVTMAAHGHRETRHVSYQVTAETAAFGGFAHSGGQATYQVATLALVACLARARAGERTHDAEVIERWQALVQVLEKEHPRPTPSVPWSEQQVRAACSHATLRPLLEQLVDALEWAIRLDVATGTPRTIGILAGAVLDADASLPLTITPADLLQPPPDVPPPAAPARHRSRHASRSIARPTSADPAKDAAAVAGTGNHAETVPVAAEPGMHETRSQPGSPPIVRGPYHARIQRALSLPGARLFLVGPTATGKTFQALQAAHELGWGIEAITLEPGKDSLDLIGGYARRSGAHMARSHVPRQAGSGGPTSPLPARTTLAESMQRLAETVTHRQVEADWQAVDGPITRWARRALAGEPVVLLLDELARGHASCLALVMSLLNRYDRATIERQGLVVPDAGADAAGYHLIEVWMTQERLVVPAERIKIIGTANLGESYLGLDLRDPAFRRRWDVWLHLGPYTPDIQSAILGDRLGLPPTSPLVAALIAVAGAVETFQHERETLSATLDLATLLTWGSTTLRPVAAGEPLRSAWLQAALDTWIDRLCPLAGADLDADTRATLTGFVTAHTPATLE